MGPQLWIPSHLGVSFRLSLGVCTIEKTAGACEPFEPSIWVGGFGSSSGFSGHKSQQIAKSMGVTLFCRINLHLRSKLLILAVLGLSLMTSFLGWWAQVLGRKIFNLVHLDNKNKSTHIPVQLLLH